MAKFPTSLRIALASPKFSSFRRGLCSFQHSSNSFCRRWLVFITTRRRILSGSSAPATALGQAVLSRTILSRSSTGRMRSFVGRCVSVDIAFGIVVSDQLKAWQVVRYQLGFLGRDTRCRTVTLQTHQYLQQTTKTSRTYSEFFLASLLSTLMPQEKSLQIGVKK